MLQNKPEDKKPEEPKFRVPIGPAVGGKEAVATIAAQFPIFPSNNPNIIVQKPANAPSAKVIYINAPTQPGAAIAIAQNTTGPELKDNSEEIVGAAIIGSLPNDPQAINTKGTLSLGSIKVPEVPFGSAVLMFDLKQGQTINTSMIKSASFVTEEGSLGGNMVTAAKDMRIAVIIPRGDHGMLQDRDPKGKTLNPNPKTALPAGKLQVYDLQVALDTYNSRLTAIKNEHERKMLSQTPTTQEDKMKDYNSLLDLYDELRTKQKEAQTVKLTPNDVSKLRDLNAKTNSAVNPYIKAMEHGKQAMSDYKSQKKNTQWTEVQGVLAYITSRHNGAEGKRPPVYTSGDGKKIQVIFDSLPKLPAPVQQAPKKGGRGPNAEETEESSTSLDASVVDTLSSANLGWVTPSTVAADQTAALGMDALKKLAGGMLKPDDGIAKA